MARLNKIPISFKRDEEDLYNFIRSKRNASCYIKDLVEKDMKNNSKTIEVNNSNFNIKDNNDLGFDF